MNKSIKINQIYNESTSPIYQNKKYNETFFQGYFNINISEDSYIETLEERTQSTMSISYKENTKQVTLTEQNGNNFSLHQGDSFIIDGKNSNYCNYWTSSVNPENKEIWQVQFYRNKYNSIQCYTRESRTYVRVMHKVENGQ